MKSVAHVEENLAGAKLPPAARDQVRRDILGAGRRAAALVALAAEHGFAFWHALGVAFEGWALAQQGRAVEGMAQIEDGLSAYRATGSALFVPYLLALQGTTCAAADRAADGQRLLAAAVDTGSANGERWFEAVNSQPWWRLQ